MRPITACIQTPFLLGSRRRPHVSEPRALCRWCYHGDAELEVYVKVEMNETGDTREKPHCDGLSSKEKRCKNDDGDETWNWKTADE
jgi:hypothetical protein